MYLAHIITDDLITIVTDKRTVSVPHASPVYEEVRTFLYQGDYEAAVESAERPADIVNRWGQAASIHIQDGVIYWGDEPVHNSLTDRILRMVREGMDDPAPLVAFLSNLMANPSARARQELYRFLESNSLPITPDGHFLAYKNVQDDYTDRHTGTFDNSVGQVVKMDRTRVMDDPNQTCAAGLHFCSIEYLNDFWGHKGHTMVVKVNPADVVSIPVDYNNSKGRCCRYEVVAEHMNGRDDTVSRVRGGVAAGY